MKKFFCLAAALIGAAGAFAAPVPAPAPEIRHPQYSIRAEGGNLLVSDFDGEPMLKIGKLPFSWSPPVAVPVRIEKIADDAFRIDYRIDRDDTGKAALTGTLKAGADGKIRLDWELDVPETVKTGGIMLELLPQKETKKSDAVFKSGLWTRHEHGGVPYEVRDGYFRSFNNGNAALWLLLGGNSNYSSAWSEHLGFSRGADGKFRSSAEFQVAPPALSGEGAAALFRGRPAGLRLMADRPFHIWESGAPELKVEVSNPYDRALKNASLEITGRDFDGNIVLDEKMPVSVKPFGTALLPFRFPAAERAIYFVEVRLVVPGEKEIFSRTNLAILPPHEFKHLDQSKFALSAYFMIPSEQDVYGLMKRMGVRILRHGDNRVSAKNGILALDHAGVGPNDSPARVAKRIGEILARAAERENPEIEFCNEWNMSVKGDEKRRRAERYVEVLREFKTERDKQYPGLKIIGMGMAGADTGFLKIMAEKGAVPLMDGGIALHPGRGNMTPDYTGDGWTYLGGIRRFRKAMDELGIRKMHLSEVYAATHPNDSWKDSYRHAAENVVLTYAIGLAEGVESIQFYQLHDAVWHDLGGVNPADSEYHYGLLMRDGTIKPSLLAYAAVAEALDGAAFAGYLDFGDKVRGIGFETPRGPLAVVYDRTDGYILTDRKKKNFAAAEPWVDTWKTRRNKIFDAVGDEVTVIDPIGRAKKVQAKNGKVTLELSGAPLMVYGIKFQGAKQ